MYGWLGIEQWENCSGGGRLPFFVLGGGWERQVEVERRGGRRRLSGTGKEVAWAMIRLVFALFNLLIWIL